MLKLVRHAIPLLPPMPRAGQATGNWKYLSFSHHLVSPYSTQLIVLAALGVATQK